MKPSMLDTDIFSEFLRGNDKAFANIEKYLLQYKSFNISIITYYEILSGLLYKDAKKQLEAFERIVALNNIIPLTVKSVKIAANIQADLRKKGSVIGHTDTLIAGIAIENNLQLITNNTAHFNRINQLDIANWLL
ncbi:MAG: type II toxin-antitoxin system VapC family toxin [Chitinophagales bacterium]|jgi:tRNA(fMet)-specific endonuclease VapC|nr:type II toxin-antitoxin system VapC family toxin [Chitinophagales bacterium]